MHAPHSWKLRRKQGHSPRRCRPVWEGFTKSQRHMTVMKVEKHSEWVRHQSWSILAPLRQTVLSIWICIELLDVWQFLDMKKQESWWLDDNDIGFHRVQVADHNRTQPEQQEYSSPVFWKASKIQWFHVRFAMRWRHVSEACWKTYIDDWCKFRCNLTKRHKHVAQTFVTLWRCKKLRSHLKS